MAGEMRRGRGVYEAEHRMTDGRPWLYAADRHGRTIAWYPYEDGNERQRDRVVARLWRTLDARDPIPALRVIRGDATDRPVPRPVFADIEPEKLGRAILFAMTANR